MKKALIIILAVVVVAAIIGIGSFWLLKNKNTAQNETPLTEDPSMPFSRIIVCKNAESLKEKANEYRATIEYDGDSFYVVGVNGWGYDFDINGVGGGSGDYAKVESYCFLTKQDEEIDPGKLYEIVKSIVPGFAEMFGIADLEGGYYICDNNGNSLDISSTVSYETVLNGEALVKTSVKESPASYWELTINSPKPTGPMCSIVHFINDSEFASVSGIINID